MNKAAVVLLVASATISSLSVVLVLLGVYTLFLAPAPQVIQVQPIPLAANPDDADHWDFSRPRVTLHRGDQLVADFNVCYRDLLGGSTVNVQGRRSIVSLDGSVRASLSTIGMTFPVGCHDTHSVLGRIPDAFPIDTYRVVGMSTSSTRYYSRDLNWLTVPFQIVP